MSTQGYAKWVAIVGVLGLTLALFNGLVASSVPWLVLYGLLIVLCTALWALDAWEIPVTISVHFLLVGAVQAGGISWMEDGTTATVATYFAGALLGLLLSVPITGVWVTLAWIARWLERRALQSWRQRVTASNRD